MKCAIIKVRKILKRTHAMKRITRIELIISLLSFVALLLVVWSASNAFHINSAQKDAQTRPYLPTVAKIVPQPSDTPSPAPTADTEATDQPADQTPADPDASTTPTTGSRAAANQPTQDDEPAPQVYTATAGGPVDPNTVGHDTSNIPMNDSVHSATVTMH